MGSLILETLPYAIAAGVHCLTQVRRSSDVTTRPAAG